MKTMRRRLFNSNGILSKFCYCYILNLEDQLSISFYVIMWLINKYADIKINIDNFFVIFDEFFTNYVSSM